MTVRPAPLSVPELAEFLMPKPGKWTLLVLTRLRDGKLRFTEIRRTLPGITQKTLTSTLRDLERNGFVQRTAFATIPPRVDYEVTALGVELLTLTDAVVEFGQKHRTHVEASRQRFDGLSDDDLNP